MPRSPRRRLLAAALSCLGVAALTSANSAHATVPGVNGKLSFLERASSALRQTVVSVSPDGSGRAGLFETGHSPGLSVSPTGGFAYLDDSGSALMTRMPGGEPFAVVPRVFGGDLPDVKADLDWSPDGTRVAFTQQGTEWTTDLHVVPAGGGIPCNLTQLPVPADLDEAGTIRHLTWSPDADEIAYVVTSRSPDAPGAVNQVRVIGADGAHDRLVLSLRPRLSVTGLDWAPDGERLAMTTGENVDGGRWTLETIELASGARQVLGSAADADWTEVQWSPDGRQLAFLRFLKASERGDVATMDAGGSAVRAVPNTLGAESGSLAWAAVHGSADAHAAAGATVSNDPAGAGATADAPLRAAVSVPAAGTAGRVVVLTGAAPATGPAGYALLGQEVRITAPAQTAADPLVLTFTLDASLLPAGISAGALTVFRNGTAVADCTASGAAAAPDPCVASRTALAGGDVRLVGRTSQASTWWFGRAAVPPYAFTGFIAPVDNLPTVNAVQAGRAVPVTFGLGGDRGLAVFADGAPRSQAVPCDPATPVDGIESTVTAGASSLSYDAATGTYTYVWKTDKAWAGTCRQLVLAFKDGTTRRAMFTLGK